ncbi:putative amp-binding enzyme [Phaeomoniella chlamydospora]|uniref:Putative amp-binding enzyme n=1 Tax=Phaeomoniella chlamydospora TaxID=158046 RepID=A0A0G2ECK6_PHACM|nr:putative amp-binding enzyme [Phaeomoniella chlamydospora]
MADNLGCMSQSLYSVSIYDTLGPDTAQYIINHAELTCVAASLPKIPALLKIKSNCPSLKIIVSLDPLDAGEPTGNSKRDILRQMAEDVDIQIYTLDEIEAIGAALNRPYNPPTADDVVTINYTSGTTGNPKGVILTHRNAVAAASNASVGTNHGTEEIICSFLPLAHIFARMAEAAGLWGGIQIGYFHGDTLGLLDDLKILKPTLLIVVPRLLNRFGGGIKAASIDAPGFKGALSRQALSTKLTNLNDPVNPTNKHMFYDRIWSRKVRQQMGMDRIKALVSGAAPLDGSMQQFLRASWGAVVAQGYGMTESYASTMVQMVDDFSTGNLGGMLPGAEACLQSIPDMEYYVTDKPFPRGEILLRGHTIFKGYLKDDEETAKSFTEDGWFKTGDVGAIDAQGRFKVIDRKKNVLKLAQGEYIAPERIEGVYLTACNYLAVAFVHGDSDKTFPVAMFGIQPDVFATWASKVLGHSISETDIEALKRAIKDPKVVAAVRKDVDRAGRKAKFAGFERVRGIKLYLDPFSIENDLMTPTLKLKRPKVVKAFRQDLDELYAGAEEKDQKVKARL